MEHIGVFSTFKAAMDYTEALEEGLGWSTVRPSEGLVEGVPSSGSIWKRYAIVHMEIDKPVVRVGSVEA
jgi:hypothetical protein